MAIPAYQFDHNDVNRKGIALLKFYIDCAHIHAKHFALMKSSFLNTVVNLLGAVSSYRFELESNSEFRKIVKRLLQ